MVHTDIAAREKQTTALAADTLATNLKYNGLGSSSARALMALRGALSLRALSPDLGGHGVGNDGIHAIADLQGAAGLYMLIIILVENKLTGIAVRTIAAL